MLSPWPAVLETPRLRLRDMVPDDLDALLPIFSDPDTMRFYPRPFDHAMMRAWIEWNMRSYALYGFGLWTMVLKATNEVIGDCGLALLDVEGKQQLEVGYHVRRDLGGQGPVTPGRAARSMKRTSSGAQRLGSCTCTTRYSAP